MPTITSQLANTRFGTIEIEEEDIIRFDDGLIGFPNCREYIVLNPKPDSAFRWLQSLDEPALAFLVVQPHAYVPDYAPTISNAVARDLDLTHDQPPLVFVTVR